MEHGHTHEHLEHAGRCSIRAYEINNSRGFMFIVGKFAERDMPDYSGRDWHERGFTIGIGG